MDSMISMRFFQEKTHGFVLDLLKPMDEIEEALIIEQTERAIKMTGGWENHYGMMLEGACNGVPMEDQMRKAAELWKNIKFLGNDFDEGLL
jgi:hypothetical protein